MPGATLQPHPRPQLRLQQPRVPQGEGEMPEGGALPPKRRSAAQALKHRGELKLAGWPGSYA